MAGHNKWSQIKHKKAKEDSKRGKAFTKLIKEITVVAKEGGGDPAHNPRLRQLLEKGKSINMPAENAQRAIKRGTGELPGVSYEELRYEGYGPEGIAVIVDTLSDNKNRTVAELRRVFTKAGCALGETGSVSWMFDKLGVIRAQVNNMSQDDMLEMLLDYDVLDIKKNEDFTAVYCDAKSVDTVKKAMEQNGIEIESAALEWVPKSTTELPSEKADKAFEFLSVLDDLDDVQNVYTNLA